MCSIMTSFLCALLSLQMLRFMHIPTLAENSHGHAQPNPIIVKWLARLIMDRVSSRAVMTVGLLEGVQCSCFSLCICDN